MLLVLITRLCPFSQDTILFFVTLKPIFFRSGKKKYKLALISRILASLRRWRSVKADDESEFHFLEQELRTNSTETRFTVDSLQPYTVYTFRVSAINIVGRSQPSKDAYPSITLMESKEWQISVLGMRFQSVPSRTVGQAPSDRCA